MVRTASRQLTGAEEAKIVRATRCIEVAKGRVERLVGERDALLRDVRDDGARISDMAGVLRVERKTAYERIERANE